MSMYSVWQQTESDCECEVPLYYNYSQVHFNQGW